MLRRVAPLESSLSQADDDLETITSILNHDARSPLVSVLGFLAELRLLHAETIEHWVPTEENTENRARLIEETIEAFSYLNEGAKRMARVLEVLGELGGFRRRVLLVESVDSAALLQELADALRRTAPDLALSLAPMPAVQSDRGALSTLLGHVLTNAVQFSRPGVPLRVEVTAECLDDRHVLRVTDNGRGIAANELQRVFRPFVRLTPLHPTGDGLGLAYARALARRLGGDLRAEAAASQGVTLVLELPHEPPSKYPRVVA